MIGSLGRLAAALRAPALAFALALAIALVGCQIVAPIPSSTPTPTLAPTPTAVDPAIVLERIERQVEAIRGLRSDRALLPTIIDEERLRSILRDLNEKENPPEVLAAQERLYKALGLLQAGDSLAALSEDLLGEQVAGFYVPETDELYVVSRSGAIGSAEKVTFAHEFDHALQDQVFNIELLTADAATQGDRSLARLALIEGDATLVMTYWAQQHLGFLELLQLFGEVFGPGQASLEAIPPFLRESLLFPYEAGLQFVMGIQLQGGWQAVNDAYAAPPDSTEQILHPEKYAARELPIVVKLPADVAGRLGPGWKQPLADTFGEFQLAAWLRSTGGNPTAAAAAAGWGGDRIGLYEGPDGDWAVVLDSMWDSEADAAEFAAACPKLGSVSVVIGARRVIVVVASDADTLRRTQEAFAA